ncbi:hypothetical protein [Acinetobacter johnsonii]|uniref:hypothetical protein n=1 Tax=Acinetobacter johnsonii TaxID=40214 RepID=UPI001D179F56|nr:hypothetical protein [Acinetobacter johnsonii]
MTAKVILLALLSLQTISIMADPPKAVWYRYYESKGIANVSSSVTPNHIRYGYEALDSNMQVIQRARPYNAEKDAQYATQRAAAAKQRESDLKLKRAYTNSQVATQKRNTALSYILKQIKFQQDELKQFSVHDKFHRTLILSGFCLLKIAKISLNSSFFPKPIKR